jgi:CxC4 like cysteine cluster associated with KDZ transposases
MRGHPVPLARKPRRTVPVSYLPRPPPVWARLQSDDVDDPEYPEGHITNIGIDSLASCICSTPEALYNPFLPTVDDECTVYGLLAAWKATIKLQKCSRCTRRHIGPDCRSHGLFNWNNTILVTEELLDDYTNNFITSETPFVAYTTVLSQRYQVRRSPIPFLSNKVFHEIWFGYITLLDLQLGPFCHQCGDEPENTIWDGITLAFNKRHLQDSLEPPTTLSEHSIQQRDVTYIGDQQCIPDRNLCQSLRAILKGPSLDCATFLVLR